MTCACGAPDNYKANDGTRWCSRRCWGAHTNWGLAIDGDLIRRRQSKMPDWDWVAAQLPTGAPGIHGFDPCDTRLDALVYRDDLGTPRGGLYRMKVNGRLGVYRDPVLAGRGIGRKLVHESGRRWGINLAAQRYTEEGWRMATHALPRGKTC